MPHDIGLFGGTFDPPHRGHVVAAAAVRRALGLAEVVLMVANDPWQKTAEARDVTPATVRLAMTRAAVEGEEGLVAGDAEIRRGGPSYTVDTVAEILESRPGARVHVIVGADAAIGVPTWHEHRRLVASATMVAVTRPGHLLDPRAGSESGIAWETVAIDPVEVSSSAIRARIAAGEAAESLVAAGWLAAPVARIIESEGLYRGPATPHPEGRS